MYFFLSSLTSFSPLEAQVLASNGACGIDSLYLNGLTSLDKKVAQALASWKGEHRSLYLNGLKILDKEAAQALKQFKGELHISDEMKAILDKTQ